MLITKQLENDYQGNSQMLSLIKSERDQLLKKNAKAKERLLDLDNLRKERVTQEATIKDLQRQLKEKTDKIKEFKTKEKSGNKSTKNGLLDCSQCKVHEKARADLALELSKSEKQTLEARNEKMMVMLESKNIEDRLKERDQEFKDERNLLKQQALNELQVQKKQYDITLKKLKT